MESEHMKGFFMGDLTYIIRFLRLTIKCSKANFPQESLARFRLFYKQ